jgi:hypothetical protein
MKPLVLSLFCALSLAVAPSALARTWHVPAYCPTIQAAVDSAAAGDTVLVATGVYSDCTHLDAYGGLNCLILKSGVCVRSEPLRPGGTTGGAVLDAGGLGRCVFCQDVDEATILEGLTFTGGQATGTWPSYSGGGIFCFNASPTIRDCRFTENTATYGAGLCCESSSSVTIADCVFAGNTAVVGGGMFCDDSACSVSGTVFTGNESSSHGGAVSCRFGAIADFSGCTFHGNSSSEFSGALLSNSGSAITLLNTIVAFSLQGSAVHCIAPTSTVTLENCDVFGNAGGDWVGCIADQSSLAGNFSADPQFCDAGTGNLRISFWSPCAAWSSGIGLVGALRVGCRGYAVERLEGDHGDSDPDPRTDVAEGDDLPIRVLTLGPAMPNPFNPWTELTYVIPAGGDPSRVVLDIFDATGRRVRRLVDANQGAGMHRVGWNGTDDGDSPVASGVYFCRIQWNGQSRSERMVLLR